MSKRPQQQTATPEPTTAPAEQVPDIRTTTVTVISPDGATESFETRKQAVEYMEANAGALARGQRFITEMSRIAFYRPKAARPARLTVEERAARKTQRLAERTARRQAREASKVERAKAREAKKAEVAARRAARAAEKELRAKAKAEGIVVSKSGARIAVKPTSATTQQLMALARARQKAAEAKLAGKK